MDNEINKIIHERVMGLETQQCCGNPHQFFEEGDSSTMGYPVCTGEECCRQPDQLEIPDYCSDLNAVREAELKAIEEKGEQVYGQSLFKYVFGYEFTGGAFDGSITVVGALKFAKATAEQRARAVKKCWEEK